MIPPYVLDALAAIAAGATAAECESERLDFNRQGRSREDAMRTLAQATMCLANGGGGAVVLGVHDRKPGSDAFEGTDIEAPVLARRIYELTHPSLTPAVEEHHVAGRRLLILMVPMSADVHQVDGRAAERVGTTCQPMSTARIATLVAERRGDDWSAEDTQVPLVRVSPVAIALARQLIERSSDPGRRTHAKGSDEDLLRRLGVVSLQGTLLRAGRLLFVDDQSSDEMVAYQYRRTPAGEPVVHDRFDGPLLSTLLRVLERVEARIDRRR